MDRLKKAAFRAATLVLVGFVVLALYSTYVQFFQVKTYAAHPKNPRAARDVIRGSILDRAGRLLAYTRDDGEREYPADQVTAHAVGYYSPVFGRAGLEAQYELELTGMDETSKFRNALYKFLGKKRRGNDLVLTLDLDLQSMASELLGTRRGAVVLLNPRTGEILALASSPAFSPTKLPAIIREQNGASPLFNRATQGLYPPGSAFKLVTASALLTENAALSPIYCPGYARLDNRKIACLREHGRIDLEDAIAYSCNTYFIEQTLAKGKEAFINTAQRFLVGKVIPFDLPVAKSSLQEKTLSDKHGLAESSIGQGSVLTSPLHMALIAAAIANHGVMMKPYMVQEIRTPGGIAISTTSPEPLAEPVTPETARILTSAMVKATISGTARAAQLPGMRVAGKTGSAENPQGPPHAWFIGFAPADDPIAAVAVIIENGGQGGKVAAPIGRALMEETIRKYYRGVAGVDRRNSS